MKKVSVFLMLATLIFAAFSYAPAASAEPNPDMTPPVFVGAESGSGYVTLHFNENIEAVPALPETIDEDDEAAVEAYRLSQIQIAQDGEHFSPLVNGLAHLYWGESDFLTIGYDNGLQIVTGPKTRVKLAAGLLQDTNGNVLTEELNLSVSPPVIEGAAVSDDYKVITVTFDRNLQALATEEDKEALKSRISLIGDPDKYFDLGENDSVTVIDDSLTITLDKPLSGANYQVRIYGGALKSAEGNYLNAEDSFITPYLQGGSTDTDGPEVLNYYFSDELLSLTLQFNEDVTISDADLATFKQNIKLYDWNQGNYTRPLPEDATVTVQGSEIKIHVTSILDSHYHNFQVNLTPVQDLHGNRNEETFYTENIYVPNLSNPFVATWGSFQLGGKYLTIGFYNYYYGFEPGNLVDATIDQDGSHLKNEILISRDNGVNFMPLSAGDKVFLNDRRVDILLQDPISTGTVRVKIKAGALSDEHRIAVNEESEMLVGTEESVLSGYLFSNSDSELNFSGNAAWLAHAGSVIIWDDYAGSSRVLSASEYKIESGKVKIKKGVFAKGRNYQVGIQAEGYRFTYMWSKAILTSDVFYMTSPTVTKSGGITAKVFIYNNQSYNNNSLAMMNSSNANVGSQAVVFELFDGTTPVSIATAELAIGTGTYTAKFNIGDKDSTNYTVKAFVVSSFDSDTGYMGLNLGTVKTQAEIDEAMIMPQNNYNP